MVRDGDSKAFEAVKSVYGPDVEIEALADKNHVTKNLLVKLNKARSGTSADGISLKGRNRITEGFAKQLASYMGKAIRDTAREGGSVKELHDAIWTVFYHKSARHQ